MARDSERDGSRGDFAPMDDLSESLVKVGRRPRPGPPAQEQWESFAAKMSLVAGGLEPLSGVHTLRDSEALTNSELTVGRTDASMRVPPPQVAGPSAAGLSAKLGLLWGGIGAVLGGALVFAWVAGGENSQTDPRHVAVPSTQEGNEPPSPAVSSAEGTLSDEEAAPRQEASSPSAGVVAVRQAPLQSSTKEPRRPEHEGAPGSTLSEEVQLLHKARSASPGRALEIISDFRKRFPNSALTADSEVIALGALLRLGRSSELKRRAERFLRLYPGDPHINRVRSYLTDK